LTLCLVSVAVLSLAAAVAPVAAADVANEPHDPGLKGSILSVAVVAGCSLLPKGELSTPKFGRRQKCIKIMYF